MPIRSVRFFLPVIDELRFAHVDQGYVNYLARKLADFLGKDLPLTGPDVIPERRHDKRRPPRQLKLPWLGCSTTCIRNPRFYMIANNRQRNTLTVQFFSQKEVVLPGP